MFLSEAAPEPVQNVEASVGAEGDKIVGINDGRDGGLAQEKELRKYTDRL